MNIHRVNQEIIILFLLFFPGTMKIHQVKWSREEKDYLYFNTLSCLDCDDHCSHYHLIKVKYSCENQPAADLWNLEDHKEKFVHRNLEDHEEEFVHCEDNADSFQVGDWFVVRFTFELGKGEKNGLGKSCLSMKITLSS